MNCKNFNSGGGGSFPGMKIAISFPKFLNPLGDLHEHKTQNRRPWRYI